MWLVRTIEQISSLFDWQQSLSVQASLPTSPIHRYMVCFFLLIYACMGMHWNACAGVHVGTKCAVMHARMYMCVFMVVIIDKFDILLFIIIITVLLILLLLIIVIIIII